MTLSESREDYLENLLILETRSGGFVRQVDMASRMGFSKASIYIKSYVLLERGRIC